MLMATATRSQTLDRAEAEQAARTLAALFPPTRA